MLAFVVFAEETAQELNFMEVLIVHFQSDLELLNTAVFHSLLEREFAVTQVIYQSYSQLALDIEFAKLQGREDQIDKQGHLQHSSSFVGLEMEESVLMAFIEEVAFNSLEAIAVL